MDHINLMFCEFPEIYSLVVELTSYSTMIVIPNDPVQIEFDNYNPMDLQYPTVVVVMEAILLVQEALRTCSSSFIFSMMKKHR